MEAKHLYFDVDLANAAVGGERRGKICGVYDSRRGMRMTEKDR